MRRRFLGESTSTPAQAQAANVPNAIPYAQGGNVVQGRGLYFSYATPNIASLAAAAATTNVIQFDNNSIFTWLRTVVQCDIAGAAITSGAIIVPLVNIQITDTGTGMSFMNGVVPIPTLAGDARLPYVLPTPQLIQPNASFQFSFTNFSAATTYANLRLVLQGFRTFQ